MRAYSITLSARKRIDGGIASASALAVLRLTIISNLVGNSIGKSEGLAPRHRLVSDIVARYALGLVVWRCVEIVVVGARGFLVFR